MAQPMWLALAGQVAVAISPRITGGVVDQCRRRAVVKILFTRSWRYAVPSHGHQHDRMWRLLV